MTGALTVAGKEVRSYLVSPVAWVVATVFLAVSGLLFYNVLTWYSAYSFQALQEPGAAPQLSVNRLVLEPTFHNMAVTLLLLTPLVTMRLLAGEQRSGTAQLLFTAPLRLSEVLLGKYFAALLLLGAVLLLSAYMPVLVWLHGDLDWGPVLSSYLGLGLMLGMCVAAGLLASSLTENQIVAAVLALGLLLGCWLMGWGRQLGGRAGTVFGQLAASTHLEDFLVGIVSVKDVVYYLSASAFLLFLTHRVLDSRRWR